MDEEISKKKKHKRKHKQDRIEDADIPETLSWVSDCISPNIVKKKKKKKSKDRALENDSENEISNIKTDNIQNDESSKVKKKRKHNKNADFENKVSQQITDEETAASVNRCELADHEGTCSKKKKSKKRKYESDNILENTDEVEHPRKEKHKKKRKHFDDTEAESNLGNEMEESESVMDEAVEQQIKKKKKKKSKKKHKDSDSNDIDDSIQDKQKSVHCERVNSVNGVGKEVDKIESKKETNTETEIDKRSIKSTENESFKSGQWSSVELGDSDRQNKFFRLLGGFKKGGDTSQIQNKFSLGKKPAFGSSNNTPRRSGGNFAMDKKQEDVYTKALESEYDRAMSMNLNRGIGLGFEKPPEEGKKFYIDKKSSKSIKFDD